MKFSKAYEEKIDYQDKRLINTVKSEDQLFTWSRNAVEIDIYGKIKPRLRVHNTKRKEGSQLELARDQNL